MDASAMDIETTTRSTPATSHGSSQYHLNTSYYRNEANHTIGDSQYDMETDFASTFPMTSQSQNLTLVRVNDPHSSGRYYQHHKQPTRDFNDHQEWLQHRSQRVQNPSQPPYSAAFYTQQQQLPAITRMPDSYRSVPMEMDTNHYTAPTTDCQGPFNEQVLKSLLEFEPVKEVIQRMVKDAVEEAFSKQQPIVAPMPPPKKMVKFVTVEPKNEPAFDWEVPEDAYNIMSTIRGKQTMVKAVLQRLHTTKEIRHMLLTGEGRVNKDSTKLPTRTLQIITAAMIQYVWWKGKRVLKQPGKNILDIYHYCQEVRAQVSKTLNWYKRNYDVDGNKLAVPLPSKRVSKRACRSTENSQDSDRNTKKRKHKSSHGKAAVSVSGQNPSQDSVLSEFDDHNNNKENIHGKDLAKKNTTKSKQNARGRKPSGSSSSDSETDDSYSSESDEVDEDEEDGSAKKYNSSIAKRNSDSNGVFGGSCRQGIPIAEPEPRAKTYFAPKEAVHMTSVEVPAGFKKPSAKSRRVPKDSSSALTNSKSKGNSNNKQQVEKPLMAAVTCNSRNHSQDTHLLDLQQLQTNERDYSEGSIVIQTWPESEVQDLIAAKERSGIIPSATLQPQLPPSPFVPQFIQSRAVESAQSSSYINALSTGHSGVEFWIEKMPEHYSPATTTDFEDQGPITSKNESQMKGVPRVPSPINTGAFSDNTTQGSNNGKRRKLSNPSTQNNISKRSTRTPRPRAVYTPESTSKSARGRFKPPPMTKKQQALITSSQSPTSDPI